ncbi:MAG TPA: hypothetical protein VK425_13125, partial [Acidimicrobiales bacterium]|nr:hypothetical protein [Acidimicrobiales bacterium]
GSLSLNSSGASFGPGKIVQLDALTGRAVREIYGARYDFTGATTMAVLGADLYVADTAADALTEVDVASGAPVQVLSGPEYGFAGPDGLTTWGAHLYVANGEGDSVTDIVASP